jgi:hypothetical protein
MEEDLVEIGPARDGPQLARVGEEVLARRALRRVVDARVILGAEPRPVLGVEIGERKWRVGELVADLLAPRAIARSIPSPRDRLRLRV